MPVRFSPLTVKVRTAEAVPWVALKPLSDAGLTVKDGAALTVPETEVVADVAPVLATLITPPVKEPAGVAAAIRISMDVESTVPLAGDKLAVDPYDPDPARRSSKPAGAVTMRAPVRLLPLTEKFCAADAVPAVVTNPDKVPAIATEGAGALTMPEIGFITGVLLPTPTETSPLKGPSGAAAAIRTLTMAFTAPLEGEIVAVRA